MTGPGVPAEQSTARRDRLQEIETKVQAQWAEHKYFEAEPKVGQEKFLVTFPYPYMNGALHVGHAFSLTKAEFTAGYQRLKGKNVCFPFAFHCTGMPIAAAAKKLTQEIAQFGNPPVFPVEEAAADKSSGEPAAKKAKGKKKKGGKTEKKKSTKKYQWQILEEMGVPRESIAEFVDSEKWLHYFPPIGRRDLERFGVKADFRRAFITTPINPYYDAFIRWQFNTLKARGCIGFGNRPSVFSPSDGQPCADHDRASGEGVNPQEYSLVKMPIVPGPTPFSEDKGYDKLQSFFDQGKTVYLVAGTLRPETMYGQTNCWCFPNGEYVAVETKSGEIWICSKQSARNMAYQDMLSRPVKDTSDEFDTLATIAGWDLLGRKLQAPNAKYEHVYVLPLLTISMDKATAIVTSVPSDAPDDYAALLDMKKDAGFRKKYFISDEMVQDYEAVPIIEIPGFGNLSAKFMHEKLKIKNQHDAKKLADAKEETYMAGFYKGIMRVGEFSGEKVETAKPKIRQIMIAAGQVAAYWEPENKVMSRSGDRCVVAYVDQWFLKYGEDGWRSQIQSHVDNKLETFNPVAKRKFQHIVGWLKEWACSRSFGLGTQVPWDDQFVIESLSDSTIYMAFYTIAHHLQLGCLEGNADPSTPGYIAPEALTDQVWNYIFLKDEPKPENCAIPQDKLDSLRAEFRYWYAGGMDLRCSGKDLIGNHLTMSLYNHAAVWENELEDRLPQAFFTNGHVMINAEKMSKSTGNFLTLEQACQEFGADATRLALADAGDGLEDANFMSETANAAILRLTKEETWMREMFSTSGDNDELRKNESEETFADCVFANEINKAVHETDRHFATMRYRDGLRECWFQLTTARDNYRTSTATTGGMKRSLVQRYIRTQLLLLAPIVPHFSDFMWQELGLGETIMKESWPQAEKEDLLLTRQIEYLRGTAHSLRTSFNKQETQRKKKLAKLKDKTKASPDLVSEANAAYLYVATEYPDWQQQVLQVMAKHYDQETGTFKVRLAQEFKQEPELAKKIKDVMQFSKFIEKEMQTRGQAALELSSPFDEADLLGENLDFITRGLASISVSVCKVSDPECPDPANKKSSAKPGHSAPFFFHSASK